MIRVNSDSDSNYLDQWECQCKTGQPIPFECCRKRHSLRHVSHVSVVRQTCIRGEKIHMKTYLCVDAGLLFIVAALTCATTAPARDLTERGQHR